MNLLEGLKAIEDHVKMVRYNYEELKSISQKVSAELASEGIIIKKKARRRRRDEEKRCISLRWL